MGLRATYQKHTLHFNFDAGTSRGVLKSKDTYYVKIYDSNTPHIFGIGECSPLKDLSIDDVPDYESNLNEICEKIEEVNLHAYAWHSDEIVNELVTDFFPSIQFGFEMALLDLYNGGKRIIFPTEFTAGKKGIPINGLIWMGDEAFMRKQIDEKLNQRFACIKMKIGAIDFSKELALLTYIRSQYCAEQLMLRVDANGAFSSDVVLEKLQALSSLHIHSIEQPIKQGQVLHMAKLCKQSPLPIALDEELIGVMQKSDKKMLLQQIAPQYIILKPSLLGGFKHCSEWIELAEELHIGWWITSALESNIGLNAISQFTATFNNPLPQGLGTGQLFSNNISSPLQIVKGQLFYTNKNWDEVRFTDV